MFELMKAQTNPTENTPTACPSVPHTYLPNCNACLSSRQAFFLLNISLPQRVGIRLIRACLDSIRLHVIFLEVFDFSVLPISSTRPRLLVMHNEASFSRPS